MCLETGAWNLHKNKIKTRTSKSHSCNCKETVLTPRNNSYPRKYIPRGITLSVPHIHQAFDSTRASTHPSPWLGLLDAASSDSIIGRRPAERGRVRPRQKRAQPQQGISKTSHSSQLDSSSAVLPGKNALVAHSKQPPRRTPKCCDVDDDGSWNNGLPLRSCEFWGQMCDLSFAHKIQFISFPLCLKTYVNLKVLLALHSHTKKFKGL